MGAVTQVEIKEAPTGSVAPATPAADPSRPEGLPEKFKTVADFAKSYYELEKKLGTGTAAQPVATPTPATPPATPASPATDAATPSAPPAADLSKYEQEFATTGKFSDQSYAELAAKGIPKGMVDQYVAGQQAAAEKTKADVFSVVGGEQQFAQVMEWARGNLSDAEKASYDKAVKASDVAAVKLAVAGMNAKMQAAQAAQYGKEPNLLGGARSNTGGLQPFANWNQVTKAMSDPRYREDESFRKEVEQRIAVSKL